MMTNGTESGAPGRQGDPQRSGRMGKIAGFAIGAAMLIVGAAISVWWLKNPPKAERKPREAQAALVEVRKLEAGTHSVAVPAMGTVVAAKRIKFASRVGGEIVEVADNFMPGGSFKAGDKVLKIEQVDYELALQQTRAELLRRKAEAEQRAADIALRDADLKQADVKLENSANQIALKDADAIRAEAAWKIEKGQQSVAKREYELLGKEAAEEDRELMLRQPQLATAQAQYDAAKVAKRVAETDRKAAEISKLSAETQRKSADFAAQAAAAYVMAAEASLGKAELDLERTNVKAPFNAIVATKAVDCGAQVAVGAELASLVGTDEFWIEATVPVDQLKWISVPGLNGDAGSKVRIFHEAAWGPGVFREGVVRRMMTELEPQGRMARLIVSVADPLEYDSAEGAKHPLILGSYVRMEIEGKEIGNVVRIERNCLHDGDRIWVMRPDNTLAIQSVEIEWSDNLEVYISGGLEDGDMLVTTDLGAPVQGMALRTEAQTQGRPEGGPQQKGREGKQPEARP
ncbi:MAG TPA: HlyD family efflux transporter periplasmic adaptor subunit [Candidatus Brocadiia bacterium]|nr:HlyD family efflux transporter periplasmic adaptor subunit [Candidatus Brocadiia bacterium]